MPLEVRPLSLQTFADGKLEEEVSEKLAWVLERFAAGESGQIELASGKATITLKLFIERDTSVAGFRCSFEEPSVKLPAKVRSGTVAQVRSGVLTVMGEAQECKPLPLFDRDGRNGDRN